MCFWDASDSRAEEENVRKSRTLKRFVCFFNTRIKPREHIQWRKLLEGQGSRTLRDSEGSRSDQDTGET